jgi:hypothetical protein
VESSCEFGIEPSGSMKCWETIERPNNLWPLEKVLSSTKLVYLVMKRNVRFSCSSK